MARAGRRDRGLLSKRDTAGKTVWYVRLYHESKERRFGSFKTKTEARDFYEKAKQEQRAGRFFPERYHRGGYELVQDTIDRYLLTIKTKKDQRSERYFARWWKQRFAGQRLNQITPEALEQARQELLTTGSDATLEKLKACTPQRVNRYLAWLRHVLNIAVRHGKLPSNPVLKLTMFKEPKRDTCFLSLEEEARLCEALGPGYTLWTRFSILTRLRQMEQFSLRWADVDLEHNLITLYQSKAGGEQYVHLNDEAKRIIEALKEGNASVCMFPSRNPKTHRNPRNFYNRVGIPARKEAGVEWCKWHYLRHTFGSRLAMSGQSERTDGRPATAFHHSLGEAIYAPLSVSLEGGRRERIQLREGSRREAAATVRFKWNRDRNRKCRGGGRPRRERK